MRLVCVSDTHQAHDFEVPPGDILIHAGDLTGHGTYFQIQDAGQWLRSLPHKHKIVIPGNHDFLFEKDIARARLAIGDGLQGLQLLLDQEVTVEGLRIWGSPWTPRFWDWAFQLGHGKPAEEHWRKIPEGLDVLITHGPPQYILDTLPRGDHVGDAHLMAAIEKLEKPPKLHVFGHIHCANGIFQEWEPDAPERPTLFVNAAICGEMYDPTNPVHVIDIEPNRKPSLVQRQDNRPITGESGFDSSGLDHLSKADREEWVRLAKNSRPSGKD